MLLLGYGFFLMNYVNLGETLTLQQKVSMYAK
jgi:hypothetical protein